MNYARRCKLTEFNANKELDSNRFKVLFFSQTLQYCIYKVLQKVRQNRLVGMAPKDKQSCTCISQPMMGVGSHMLVHNH